MNRFQNTTQHFKLLAIAACALLFVASCKKDIKTEYSTVTHVRVHFQNTVNGIPVAFGVPNYVNAAGNTYSVSTLKYYISHFSLIDRMNTVRELLNYKLIDAVDSSKSTFTLTRVPNTTYAKIRFYVGLDSTTNHAAGGTGDLAASNGMFWNTNAGYTFFKHEGNFVDTNSATQPLQYNWGGDGSLVAIDLPLNQLVLGEPLDVYINFDLNKLYSTPAKIDFNGNSIHLSPDSTADVNYSLWSNKLRSNFLRAFSVQAK